MINQREINVRYGETDMMGIVYHANYLLFFEDGRNALLEEAGAPYDDIEKAGYMCPIYDVSIHYGSPLRFGEKAFVRTSIGQVRPMKITYHQEVYRADMVPGVDAPCVSGDVTCCIVDRATFKPASFKRVVPEAYERYTEICEPLHE